MHFAVQSDFLQLEVLCEAVCAVIGCNNHSALCSCEIGKVHVSVMMVALDSDKVCFLDHRIGTFPFHFERLW